MELLQSKCYDHISKQGTWCIQAFEGGWGAIKLKQRAQRIRPIPPHQQMLFLDKPLLTAVVSLPSFRMNLQRKTVFHQVFINNEHNLNLGIEKINKIKKTLKAMYNRGNRSKLSWEKSCVG